MNVLKTNKKHRFDCGNNHKQCGSRIFLSVTVKQL